MRALLTAVNCPKGETELNLARHLELLRLGTAAGCDLVLLPEMSLTGYLASAALALDSEPVAVLVAATRNAAALSFGLTESTDALPYITQVVAANGQLISVHRKTHLGEGEDAEFQVGPGAGVFTLAGMACSHAICAEIGAEPLYDNEAQLILGPAAPGLYGDRRRTDDDWRRGFEWWHGSVRDDATRLLRQGQLLAVSAQAGATSDEDFPGWAGLVSAGGRVLAELPDWREGELVVDLRR